LSVIVPAPVRIACVTWQIEAAGSLVGTYDEAAQATCADIPKRRAEGPQFSPRTATV